MGRDEHPDIGGLLHRCRSGDERAERELFDALYDELKLRAQGFMRRQPLDHTLQATALLSEAYVRFARGPDVRWSDRSHFLAAACRAMRTVLIDHARSKGRAKRGGDRIRVMLGEFAVDGGRTAADLLDLTDALDRFAELDSRAAQIVELRFFGGLTCEDAARVAGVSKRAAERDWQAARAWLRKALA